MARKLPKLNPAKSIRDWDRWGAQKSKAPVAPRVYEQHVPRAEKETAAKIVVKKKVRRK